MKVHELKCWPEPFQDMVDGVKRFEIRKNDRGFKAGDALHLREWDPATSEYTTREAMARVSYVVGGDWGLAEDIVVMQLDFGWTEDPIAFKRRADAEARTKALEETLRGLGAPR